ncbi:MAG: GDP-L-fucose synthase [SAR324 cluster bacterium]|nr:GDP-L-fucose synthase [SAR324 cluster bacterium]MBL7035676.1 GDP-L-fucose synthase [SAR324 cluster bacterium]
MKKKSHIYVAGHRGLVGSAILRALKQHGFENLIVRTHAELELLDTVQVQKFFEETKPEYVFLAAAKVGGIHANNTYPADFLRENLVVQTNVIHESWKHGVEKLIFLGSSCIYPKLCPQPIKEEYLLSGELEKTNEAYALAKIAGIKTCQSYNQQYGTNFVSAMPTNLYGINDNFHPENSHVLPALLRKFHQAKLVNAESVNIWGSGRPRREFLHSDDLAAAVLFLMENYNESEIVNIGCGQDQTIKELAETIQEVVGFSGRLAFDSTRPDGTPQKILDISKIKSLGWQPAISLKEGLKQVYRWYTALK